MRMRRRLGAVALAAAIAVTSAAAGCAGGGSSPASTPASTARHTSSRAAARLLADVRAAVAAARSVHVRGQLADSAATGFDLRLSRLGGTGTVSSGGSQIGLRRVHGRVYVTGDAAFFRHYTTRARADRLAGRWLAVPASDPRFAGFTRLTDMGALLGRILAPAGPVAETGTRTLHGRLAIGLRDRVANGGTLYVAATGPPYPLEIVTSGARHGLIRFGGWGAPVALAPPPSPLGLDRLGVG
jgi:hypothetical protein